MKRITLFLFAALLSVVAFAQKPEARAVKNASSFTQYVQPELFNGAARTQTGVISTAKKQGQASPRGTKKAPSKVQGDPNDIITEVPATAEVKVYQRSGKYHAYANGIYSVADQTGTAQVAFDGDDVYILSPVAGTGYSAWVKGTKDGNTITVPLGQFMTYSESYGYGLYLTLADVTATETSFTGVNDTEATEITYTIDGDNIVLNGTSATRVLTLAWSDDETVYMYGSAGGEYETVLSPYEAPSVVTLPEGLTPKEYPLSATLNGSTAITGTAYVAVDGDDVYFQGIDQNMPEAWVKGTKSGSDITVPITYLGIGDDGPHYFGGYSSGNFVDATISYTADGDFYTGNGSIIINSTAEGLNYLYFYNGLLIGEKPSPVSPPEGLETTEYPFTGRSYYSSAWHDVTSTVNVGFDGDDVYIQGLLSLVPNGWVKGKVEDGKLKFANGQYVGDNTSGSAIYAVGYDNGAVSDFTFTIATEGLYISDGIIFENSKADAISYYRYYSSGAVIGVDEEPELITLPEGVEAKEYPFTGTISQNGASVDFSQTVQVAVDGNDVYIAGLNTYVPDAWVKGTKSGDTVTFPIPQNLGVYADTYQFYLVGVNPETEALEDVVFKYDEKNDAYVLQNSALLNGEKYSIYYYKWYNPESIIGEITPPEPVADGVYTFNFNALDPETTPTSNNGNEGDITQDKEIVEDGVVLTISPSGGNTPNRFWLANNVGIQLRVYGGTLTFEVPEGSSDITKIVFNNARWNDANAADTGEFDGNTWTGSAQKVVVSIAGNTQLNSIEVTVGETEEESPIDKIAITPAEGKVESLQNFVLTVGDYKITVNEDAIPTINDAAGAPIAEGGMAANDDGTAANIDFDEAVTEPGDYALIIPAGAITIEGYNEEVPELMFKYTIEGEEKPDYTIDPAEGEVESLGTFTITFNNYIIETIDEPEAILFNNETEEEVYATIYDIQGGKQLYMSFDEVTTPGSYTLIIPDGAVKKLIDDSILPELDFFYTIVGEEPGEDTLVELPEGVEPEDWYLDATGSFMGYMSVNQDALAVKVAFDGDDVYMSGLAYFFPESYVKGTIKGDQIIVPSGQFLGGDDYGDEYLLGSEDGETISDIVFNYDAEGERFTSATAYIIENDASKDEISPWVTYTFAEYYKNLIPEEVVTPPADLETEVYIFKADEIVTDDGDGEDLGAKAAMTRKIAVEDVEDEGFTFEPVEFEVNVGFDGDDIYVQGFAPDWQPEAWVKGTVDGNAVTFDDAQYLGDYTYNTTTYTLFFHGTDWDEWSPKPLPFNTDADRETITIANDNDCLVISGGKNTLQFFSCYTNVEITKKVTDGIETINANDNLNVSYFDLQGRAVSADTKGVLIRQTIGKDGKVQVTKIIRK